MKDQYSGQYFGDYRLIQLLGEGGFANVYLGEHVQSRTQAAIKVLKSTVIDEMEINSFIDEANKLASLKHPHIVKVFSFAIQDNLPAC